MKNNFKFRTVYLSLIFIGSISAKAINPSNNEIAKAMNSLGCESFRDSLFESLQTLVQNEMKSPSTAVVENSVRTGLDERFLKRLSQNTIDELSEKISSISLFLLHEVPTLSKNADGRSFKKTLGALKVGDRSSTAANRLQQKISVRLAEIAQITRRENISCLLDSKQETSVFSSLQLKALAANVPLSVFGIRKALATAYQSCNSLSLPPMDGNTPAAEGVVETGNYPGSWTGKYYKIENQDALNNTHYYIKNFASANGCINVKKYSMIYDFGGKPVTTAGPNSTLNYWENNNDGSPGLGVDCSGYVFTSLAAGGLRLISGKKIVPSDVEDFSASMYIDPANNGFSCLNKAKMGKSGSLQPGDILASKYHVATVERVGKDPLAIRKYSDCGQISYRDFDFVIAQSSPDKGTIGINKFAARDYLAPFLHFGFRDGLEKYAKEACEALQQGTDSNTSSTDFGVSRHIMTPDCIQSEIVLDGQTCIEKCSELFE